MDDIVEAVRRAAFPLAMDAPDYSKLLARIGDKELVLLGEASHGTHEFYRARADITRQLIEHHGFDAVVVEADWPDAYRVNRYVQGADADPDAEQALSGFERFPLWMWRNADVLDFVGWMRSHNEKGGHAGFYGMDLYSLHRSAEAVIGYLDRVDRAAAKRARQRYSCFDHSSHDAQAYGYAAGLGLIDSCEDGAIAQLLELQQRAPTDDHLYAEQNARLVKNAERYYRSMYRGRIASWNLRDEHMAETIEVLRAHFGQKLGRTAKLVVWAHNSHLGDASATSFADHGEHNVGQLVRQKHGDRAALIGFTTHTGTVTCAHEWDQPAQRKRVRPSLPGSYEAVLHQVGMPAFLLTFDDRALAAALEPPLLERAIGVVYRPETERASHYFRASLSRQFDAVIHVDETRAVEPLDRGTGAALQEVPETFPSGL